MSIEQLPYSALPGRYDEAIDENGDLRRPWVTMARAFGAASSGVAIEWQRSVDRLLDAEGAGHLVHELALERWSARTGSPRAQRAHQPWRLDPMPYILSADDFTLLSEGVIQRVEFLERLLGDLSSDRWQVRSGAVPGRLLFSRPGFRSAAVGATDAPSARRLVHVAVDVVRTRDGAWRVVQDLVDAPGGLGYALLNRAVLARVLPESLRLAGVSPIQGQVDVLRRALTAASPPDRPSPRCVLLTSGPSHPRYIEQSYLATLLGYHVAEGADLVMRQGRLWLRALDALEPLDVVYRAIDDAELDPLEPHHLGGGRGVPGLVWGAQRGGVTLANAYGAGVLEDPLVRSCFAATAASLLDRPLLLAHHQDSDGLATSPVYATDSPGQLTPASVVLRLHAVVSPDGITVMPGATGRVVAPGDDLAAPTARLAKDVWVVGMQIPAARRAVRASLPQVDFGLSVSKRAADALYHLGRSLERAEVAARVARVIGVQLELDPMVATHADGGWGLGASALLRSAQAKPLDGVDIRVPVHDRIGSEVRGAAVVAAEQLAVIVQEASSVREFLSATTGRVLGELMLVRADLVANRHTPDDLDKLLVHLAALSGLVNESTVRGPGWRFLDLGRRLERAMAVVGTVESALGLHAEALSFQPLAEAALSANESLVAYRRRYRSDVDLDAVIDLLVRNDSNPRSLAFQLDRLREHVAALAWTDGVGLVQQASMASLADVDPRVVSGRRVAVDALVVSVRAPLLELGAAIGARWFADPVNPTLVRGQ